MIKYDLLLLVLAERIINKRKRKEEKKGKKDGDGNMDQNGRARMNEIDGRSERK